MKIFSKERKLLTTFKRKTNEINNVNAEVSQRFSVSLIFYLFFNVNLLKICEQSERKTIFIKSVNDVNVLTYSINTKKNWKILKKLHVIFKT